MEEERVRKKVPPVKAALVYDGKVQEYPGNGIQVWSVQAISTYLYRMRIAYIRSCTAYCVLLGSTPDDVLQMNQMFGLYQHILCVPGMSSSTLRSIPPVLPSRLTLLARKSASTQPCSGCP